jgi:hypothetical protein
MPEGRVEELCDSSTAVILNLGELAGEKSQRYE